MESKPAPLPPLGAVVARQLLETMLSRVDALPVTRSNLLAFPDGGGCLVIVWGDVVDPAASAAEAHPQPGSCPKCRAATVLGNGDGDGDLVCGTCGHSWHDPALVDSAPATHTS